MICLSRARSREKKKKGSLAERSNPVGRTYKWCRARPTTPSRRFNGTSTSPSRYQATIVAGRSSAAPPSGATPSGPSPAGATPPPFLLFSFSGGVSSRVFIDHHFPFVPERGNTTERSKHPVGETPGCKNRERPFPFPPPPSPIEAQRPSTKAPLSSSSSVVGRAPFSCLLLLLLRRRTERSRRPPPPPVWAERCTFGLAGAGWCLEPPQVREYPPRPSLLPYGAKFAQASQPKATGRSA